MFYSLNYVSTILFLVFTVMGVVRALGIEQGQAIIYIVLFSVVASLVATLLARRGSSWPFYGVIATGFLSFSHFFTLEFPLPGLIIFGLNCFFWLSSCWLMRKVLFINIKTKIEFD